MNKFFRYLMVVALACAVFACKDDEKKEPLPDPLITVAEVDKSVAFGSDAEEKTITLSVNREVRITSSETWCTPTVTVNADNSVSLLIAVAQNETTAKRTATITVTTRLAGTGDKLTFLEIPVEQKMPLLNPFIVVAEMDKTVPFTSDADDRTITLSTNREVEVTSSETWCTATVAVNADESVSLRIVVTQNETALRTAVITVTTKPAKTGDKTTSIEIVVEQDDSVQEIEKNQWTIESSSGYWTAANGVEADKTIDGKPNTFWHTQTTGAFPYWFIIYFHKPLKISGILFTNSTNGSDVPKHVIFEASNDMVTWTNILEINELSAVVTEQTLPCDKIVSARYLRLSILNSWTGGGWTYVAEISIY